MRLVFFLAGLVLVAVPARAAPEIMLPVVWNKQQVGEMAVPLEQGGSPRRARVQDLLPWTKEHLSPDSQETLAAVGDYLPLGTTLGGVTLTYNEEFAVLVMEVDSAALKTRSLSLEQGAPVGKEALEPARVSVFLNTRAGLEYIHRNVAAEGRQPARLDLDGAVNVKGWVVEARGDYLEGDSRPWRRDDVRLVHDWPEVMVRFAAGDLSYPITAFQNYHAMAGVSLARNFSLQPYRITEPAGDTSFILQSPSRVDILVNGQLVRTLQLDPGPYDIADFPLSDGSNDVTLVITDATGRVERRTFPFLSDQKLLRSGLHEYAYNLGVLSYDEDRRIIYDGDRPAFSGFHRYGFSDTLTGGMTIQADGEVQQLGLLALSAFEWGTLGLEAGFSHDQDEGAGTVAQLSYRYQDTVGSEMFSTSLEYRSEYFTALGQDDPFNPAAWEAIARYSRAVPFGVTMGIGGRYRFGRAGEEDDWSYSLNFNRMITDTLAGNLNFSHQRDEGAGIFVGITWTPRSARHTVSASVDTLTKSQDVRWDWREGRDWQMGAGITHEEDRTSGTGNINYSGERLEASARHDVTRYLAPMGSGIEQEELDQRSRLTLGTAIAFADGHVGVSRPIAGSFVMLAPHDNLAGSVIGINPEAGEEGETDYEAAIDFFGPAVIPDSVPYMYRPVKIDTRGLPLGYDVGADSYTALPGYKSGTVITIGHDANIYADGHLYFSDGNPVSLQAGMIAGPGGAAQEFFTNRSGRFRITRLSPGAHTMTLHNYPDKMVSLDIPDQDKPGKFDAGRLVLP